MSNLPKRSDFLDAAEVSHCGHYRWSLTRGLDPFGEGLCLFVMLNPSTADAHIDDPTSRRCINFAMRWGYAQLVICNLFSFRATKPGDMKKAADPVGRLTDGILYQYASSASRIVCAWGQDGVTNDRDIEVMRILRAANSEIYCLGETKNGSPVHPLYQPATAALNPYKGRSPLD